MTTVRSSVVILSMLLFHQSHGVSYTLKRFFVPSSLPSASTCPPVAEVPVPKHVQLVRPFCLLVCQAEPLCKFFTIVGKTCRLESFGLTPGYSVPGPNSLTSYSILSSSADLALNKPATQGTFYPGYPQPPTVVNGVHCRTDPMQCACTQTSNQWIQVDLQNSVLVTRVVVTASFSYDIPYYANVNIHVGDTGSHLTDPVVGTKDSSYPTSDLQQFTYSMSAQGRYVTVHRYLGQIALCLCYIQVFSD